jgi:hypothetical protein
MRFSPSAATGIMCLLSFRIDRVVDTIVEREGHIYVECCLLLIIFRRFMSAPLSEESSAS